MVEHLLIDTGIAQGIPYSKYPNLDTILICIVSIFRRGNKPDYRSLAFVTIMPSHFKAR